MTLTKEQNELLEDMLVDAIAYLRYEAYDGSKADNERADMKIAQYNRLVEEISNGI
jgi:hypothetical protein